MSEETYKCVVSGKIIPPERVEALEMLGLPKSRWTCVEHALDISKKGIYLGEVGTSELLIVDRVYNDSVRSVFNSANKSASIERIEKDDDDADILSYREEELIYYTSNEEQIDPDEKIEIIKRQNT